MVRHVEHVMGMAVSYAVRGELHDGALERSVAFLHWVDATFSTYKADSEINRLARGEVTLAECSPEVAEILERAEELRAETDGYFDVHAAPFDRARLDPSGLVKGWAVDRAVELLDPDRTLDVCVNAGGDIALRSASGRPWRVGIRSPFDRRVVVAVIEARELGVATSATYERGEHILDPHTGRPPRGLASVTVVGPDLTTADAYATAAFAMGCAGPRWVAARPGFGVFAVGTDGRAFSSERFRAVRPAA